MIFGISEPILRLKTNPMNTERGLYKKYGYLCVAGLWDSSFFFIALCIFIICLAKSYIHRKYKGII